MKPLAAVTFLAVFSGCYPVAEPGPQGQRPVGPYWPSGADELELQAFGYFGGSFRWKRRFAEMTDGQRRAVQGLTQIQGDDGCPSDQLGFTLIATTDGGEPKTAFATGRDCSDSPGALVSYASLSPLLGTLRCFSTYQIGGTILSSHDAGEIFADDGCFHGIAPTGPDRSFWFRIRGSEPATPHTIAFPSCATQSALSLYDPAGKLLATTAPDAGTPDAGVLGAGCAPLTFALDGGLHALEVRIDVPGHAEMTFTSAP